MFKAALLAATTAFTLTANDGSIYNHGWGQHNDMLFNKDSVEKQGPTPKTPMTEWKNHSTGYDLKTWCDNVDKLKSGMIPELFNFLPLTQASYCLGFVEAYFQTHPKLCVAIGGFISIQYGAFLYVEWAKENPTELAGPAWETLNRALAAKLSCQS